MLREIEKVRKAGAVLIRRPTSVEVLLVCPPCSVDAVAGDKVGRAGQCDYDHSNGKAEGEA